MIRPDILLVAFLQPTQALFIILRVPLVVWLWLLFKIKIRLQAVFGDKIDRPFQISNEFVENVLPLSRWLSSELFALALHILFYLIYFIP